MTLYRDSSDCKSVENMTADYANALEEKARRAEVYRALLERLQQWDHMQSPTADGPYWLREIAAALSE